METLHILTLNPTVPLMFSLQMFPGNWEGFTIPLEVLKTMTKIELSCFKGWNIWKYKGVKIK